MSEENQESASDWLMIVGALLLFGSLFLTWSHQLSPELLSVFGHTQGLQGVPANPTGWQVYSAADVVLAVLAVALVAAAVAGNRAARQCAFAAALIGMVFVIHALSVPPTNGTLLYNPAQDIPQYAPNMPSAGPGETLALIGLVLALVGLALSFRADSATGTQPDAGPLPA